MNSFIETQRVLQWMLPVNHLGKAKSWVTLYMILSNTWKTKEYKDIGWLLLISLDKVMKAKDEFRNSNSQLQLCVLIIELIEFR